MMQIYHENTCNKYGWSGFHDSLVEYFLNFLIWFCKDIGIKEVIMLYDTV